MNIIIVLLFVLLLLMTAIGGERGLKSFFTLCLNFITLFSMLILILSGLDPLRVTMLGCAAISSITLFYINGFNKKTVSALISVIVVVLLTMFLTFRSGTNAKIQGFSFVELDRLSFFLHSVPVNFAEIAIAQVLFGLLGAIIDVAISISSSMNELYKNDYSLTKGQLFKSGLNIGRDILGTMTNTLLFAYIAGFMTLIIYFNEIHYSLSDMLNSKVFGAQIFQILSSGIGIILIIPATAFITSRILSFNVYFKKYINIRSYIEKNKRS